MSERLLARGFASALRIRRTTAPESVFRACSQIRRTNHQCRRNIVLTFLSLVLFAAIFAAQNAIFVFGMARQPFGHPCQKQPSTNTATRCRGKTRSGFPNNLKFLRQPLMRFVRRIVTSLASVEAFPRLRTAIMFRERCSGADERRRPKNEGESRQIENLEPGRGSLPGVQLPVLQHVAIYAAPAARQPEAAEGFSRFSPASTLRHRCQHNKKVREQSRNSINPLGYNQYRIRYLIFARPRSWFELTTLQISCPVTQFCMVQGGEHFWAPAGRPQTS